MRKLMWITVGFVVACVVGVYYASGFWLLLLALLSLLAGVPLFFLKTKYSRIAAVAMMGCVFGFLWLWGYHLLYLNVPKSYDGKTIDATVQISDYSYDTSYGYAADGKIQLKGKSYNIRTYLIGEGALCPGDSVNGKIRLRMTIQGSKQPATHHQGDGIFLLGYMDEEAVIQTADSVPGKFLPAKWRQDILTRIEGLFPSDTEPFAKALLLSEHHDLSYEQDTAFKVSGIRHVIAVSGLHVSILFSLIYLITGRQRHLTVLLGIPILILFAAAAGFTPSIVRACIMQGLIIIALVVNKEYDPPTALAAAVLVMLLYNPITITSVSFQLSAGCMVGIFLFSGRIHDYLLRGKRKELAKGKSFPVKCIRWIISSVSVTLSAMITTVPLSAWYFGAVSLVGVVTNLLTLWLISFIFYGIMLACFMGAIWIPLGSAVAWGTSWLMRYVLLISKLLSKLPLAAVYTASVYIIIWLVVVYAMLVLFFLSKKKRAVTLVLSVVISLVMCVAASYIEPRLDDYRITVFNVGQGQCVLLQSEGENYLVDCGGDNNRNAADQVAQLLLSQGVTQLDGLFLTHYDVDHAGGAEPLLSQISAKTLYLPDIDDSGTIRQNLTKRYGKSIVWVKEVSRIQGKGFTISLFPAAGTEAKNENSLCLLFQRKNYDILITGDRNITGEQALLAQAELPTLELLILGHHGAADSTGFELLEVTRPAVAVASAGYDNHFNHPSQQVQTRLKLFGTKLYRTDHHGTILFRG